MDRAKNFAEPWIERLIQNYDKEQRESWLKCYVLAVCKVPELGEDLVGDWVSLLYVSDGFVKIPGLLTRKAWEALQLLEDRDSFSSLERCTVALRRYSMLFHAERAESDCNFFLILHEISTSNAGEEIGRVPCCTTLPSVRQLIHVAWRSWQTDHSPHILDSGFSLTELLDQWQTEQLSCLLEDIRGCLGSSTAFSYRPTKWDADRIRWKGEAPFTVPQHHLYIPEQQSVQILQHSERAESQHNETASRVDTGTDDPAPVADGTTAGCSRMEETDSIQDSDQEHDGGPTNPWDMFASAVVSGSSVEGSPSESVTPDGLRPPRVSDPDLDPIPSTPVPVPMATSTQMLPPGRSFSNELFTHPDQRGGKRPAVRADLHEFTQESEESDCTQARPGKSSTGESDCTQARPGKSFTGESDCTQARPGKSSTGESSLRTEDQSLPPFQMPRPSMLSSGSSAGNLLPTPLLPSDPAFAWEGGREEVKRKARKRENPWKNEEPHFDDVDDESLEGKSAALTESPPSWLLGTQATEVNRNPRVDPMKPGTRIIPTPAARAHPDGTPFTYSYQQTARVAEALSTFRVPDGILRWSIRYLTSPDLTKNTA